MVSGPKTLLEAVEYFKDQDNCIKYLAAKRWPDGVVKCPTCGGDKVSFLKHQNKWQCSARHSKRQFSVKVGTIMEDSPIGLDNWLPVLWLIANCRNGISSWEIHRSIGVTQKTAWFMLHRVRLAMQDDLSGGCSAVKWKWMNRTSAAKCGTCTRTANAVLRRAVVTWATKPL